MKQNQFFNILKVQHSEDTFPKFEPCLKKIGDFITPESCAILLLNWYLNWQPNWPDDVVFWTSL